MHFKIVFYIYVVFLILLIRSYETTHAHQGNFLYGLITYILGYYIFIHMHLGKQSYFYKKNPDSRDFFFVLLGSCLLIATVLTTTKSLFILAYFSIIFALITIVSSWILVLLKNTLIEGMSINHQNNQAVEQDRENDAILKFYNFLKASGY